MTCIDSFNLLEKRCLPKIENCLISLLDQPEGLSIVDVNGIKEYHCDECHGLFYPENGRCDQECDIDHCNFCVSEHYCTQCEDGFIPFFSTCLAREAIDGCKDYNSSDNRLCETCEMGWSLNWDKTRCLNCLDYMEGCDTCESTRVKQSTEIFKCTNCLDRFTLGSDGVCAWDICLEKDIIVETDNITLEIDNIYGNCTKCNDWYGQNFDLDDDVRNC